MKKTLTLLALLGSITTTTQAAEYWAAGVDKNDPDTMITQKKYLYELHDGVYDLDMCGVVGAADVVAMWQEVVSKSGAVIIPEGVPQRYDVWETMRLQWTDRTLAFMPMELWVSGQVDSRNPDSQMREAGLNFKGTGYYPHLEGSAFITGKHNEYTVYKTVYGTLGQTTYSSYSAEVVDMMQDGWIFCFCAGEHVMTVYGVETSEVEVGGQTETAITKMWYSDNNYKWGDGVVREAEITSKLRRNSDSLYDMYSAEFCKDPAYGNGVINYFTGMRTKDLRFDSYGMTMTGAEGEEDLFSHYLNLTVDGADYSLKYDLRNALGTDSPVDSQGEKTGDISLKSGHLSLVDSTADKQQIDHGGSTEGILSFEASERADATRKLTVARTGEIADTVQINTESGNELEVSGDHIAKFGKLTGTGNLTKTGTGTAEVTEAVSLKGSIDVKQGKFILGVNATLSADTVLTVAKEAHMESSAEKAVTLTINSGVHTNDGEMTLTTTVNTGATLKGSGTFGKVTIAGGEMIVGNSPGHQEYTDSLTLSSGKLVFCVSGFGDASSGDNVGWESGTYSTINMGNHEFIVNPEGEIVISLGGEAANTLTQGGDFSLELVSGMANTLTNDQLAALAAKTTFQLSDEEGAGIAGRAALTQPQFAYKMSGNALVLTAGASDNGNVPEPATSTLSLLALAALCKRRRRK